MKPNRTCASLSMNFYMNTGKTIPGHVPGRTPQRGQDNSSRYKYEPIGAGSEKGHAIVPTKLAQKPYLWMTKYRAASTLDMGIPEYDQKYGSSTGWERFCEDAQQIRPAPIDGVGVLLAHLLLFALRLLVTIAIRVLLVWFLQPVLVVASIFAFLYELLFDLNPPLDWQRTPRYFFRPKFATLLFSANLVASVFHVFLGIFVLSQCNKSTWRTNGSGEGDGYVRLPVWLQIIDIKTSCASGGGVSGTSDAPFELYPRSVKAQCQEGMNWASLLLDNEFCAANQADDGVQSLGINLTAYTAIFFLLSGGFHLLNMVIILVEVSGYPCVHGFFRRLNLKYLENIDECRQPLRWIEYSFSASIMMVIVSFFSGVRDVRMLLALFGLMFCVITYGWVCECLSSPKQAAIKVEEPTQTADGTTTTIAKMKFARDSKTSADPKLGTNIHTQSRMAILEFAVLVLVWSIPFWMISEFANGSYDSTNAPTEGQQAKFLEVAKTGLLTWAYSCGVISVIYLIEGVLPDFEYDPPTEDAFDGPVKEWSIQGRPFSAIVRLAPNLLGYIPYAIAWSIPMSTFYYTKEYYGCDGGERSSKCPPDFVDYIVTAQFLLFSVFSIVSIYQQLNETRVGLRYAWGELLYIALSLASKGILGALLIGNILFVSGSIDQSLVSGSGNETGSESSVSEFASLRNALCLREACTNASEEWFQCTSEESGRFYTRQIGAFNHVTNNGSCAVWGALREGGCEGYVF